MAKLLFRPISMEETRVETFFRFPQALIKSPAYAPMSAEAKIAYALIWDRRGLSVANDWQEDGEIYVLFSRRELGSLLNCTEKTASKVMAELRSYGLIREKKMGMNRPNLIFVGRPDAGENTADGPVKITVPEGKELPARTGKKFRSGPVKVSPESDLLESDLQESYIPPISPQGETVEPSQPILPEMDIHDEPKAPKEDPFKAEFEDWWKGYPRPVGKVKARDRFIELRRKEKVPLDTLILARDIYAKAREGKDPQFTLHASTFLGKQRRWEEYLEFEQAARAQSSDDPEEILRRFFDDEERGSAEWIKPILPSSAS